MRTGRGNAIVTRLSYTWPTKLPQVILQNRTQASATASDLDRTE